MCGNPFEINEEVNSDFEVEKTTTTFQGINPNILNWRNEEECEVLTLAEILQQVKHAQSKYKDHVPFIRVDYETGLWGVIFEAGNYTELDKQWIVHGITKGYA